MNLAQLIDPEKVQQDELRKAPIVRAAAPRPPMGVITRNPDLRVVEAQLRGVVAARQALPSSEKPKTQAALIREAVAAAPDGMTFDTVKRALGDLFKGGDLSTALASLVSQGGLRREGTRGSSRWFITEAGRKLLEQR